MLAIFYLCTLLLALASGLPRDGKLTPWEKLSRRTRHGDGFKVIGGQDADQGEYPYMVSWQGKSGDEWSHMCGASLIDKQWALTACHCVSEGVTSRVYLAEINQKGSNAITVDVAEQIPHEDCELFGVSAKNDLALLRLAEPIPDDERLQLIPLPTQGQSSSGLEAVLTGWGMWNKDGAPDILQELDPLPIVDDDKCRTYYEPERIRDNNICAGRLTAGTGACYGDSGGPLVCTDASGSKYQCGIVSWGDSDPFCSETEKPDVYTEVSPYVEWIQGKINSYKN